MEQAKTRKPHKKSRTGCLPCKGRHVKCDEQKPNCANCVKQGTPCEYKPLDGSRNTPHESPVDVASPSVTPNPNGGSIVDQAFPTGQSHLGTANEVAVNISQLRLLHHYTTVTGKISAPSVEAEYVMTTLLIQIAFKHAYLLYATLALSALHLHRLGDEDVAPDYWLHQSELYHNAALNAFQITVRDIDDNNFRAVLLFANTLFPYACVASISASDDMDHTFDSVLSHLVLTRRIRPMVTARYQQMRDSELQHIIPSDVRDVDWLIEEAPVETELTQLRKFAEVVHHVYPPDIIDAYGYAIHILELTFNVAARSQDPPSDALLKIWIHFVSNRYMELLSEKQPGSVIIFAHYAVMLHRAEHLWYLEGVADQILKIAEYLVPTEWASWLDWPKQQIRNTPQTPGSVTMSPTAQSDSIMRE
ncbi:hypothetical protein ACN47E_004087 [Coniothyrium glycines]